MYTCILPTMLWAQHHITGELLRLVQLACKVVDGLDIAVIYEKVSHRDFFLPEMISLTCFITAISTACAVPSW